MNTEYRLLETGTFALRGGPWAARPHDASSSSSSHATDVEPMVRSPKRGLGKGEHDGGPVAQGTANAPARTGLG